MEIIGMLISTKVITFIFQFGWKQMKHIILPRKSKPFSLGRDKSPSALDCVPGIMLDTVKDAETKGRVPPSSSLGCQGEKQMRGGYVKRKGAICFQRKE